MSQEHRTADFEAFDWRDWQAQEQATLLFPMRQQEVLLIHKQRGLGAGKITGPGGRLDPGESLEACARRELYEEVGLQADEIVAHGSLCFQFVHGLSMLVYVYSTRDFRGELITTEEAIPFWVDSQTLPYERMWADARIWMPKMLRNETFQGQFLFDQDTLIGHRFS